MPSKTADGHTLGSVARWRHGREGLLPYRGDGWLGIELSVVVFDVRAVSRWAAQLWRVAFANLPPTKHLARPCQPHPDNAISERGDSMNRRNRQPEKLS